MNFTHSNVVNEDSNASVIICLCVDFHFIYIDSIAHFSIVDPTVAQVHENKAEYAAIVLKLVSKDYRVAVGQRSVAAADASADKASAATNCSAGGSCASGNLAVTLHSCIKVSYTAGEVMSVTTGSEARVAVQLHEMIEVRRVAVSKDCDQCIFFIKVC